MTDIVLADLTNATNTTDGTGIFDVLTQAVERHIDRQFDQGRITGTDYATVYLGALQSVLAESMKFVLSEQEAGLKGDAIRSQIEDARNKSEAELEKQWGYAVTRDGTTGDNILGASLGNGLIDEQTLEAKQKVDLATGQTAKIYADVSLVAQKQESELGNSTSATGGILKAKEDLLKAQTLGFVSDTKQKILKQMLEGYAVTLSITGTGVIPPNAIKEPTIDDLAQEILTDVGTTVTIP